MHADLKTDNILIEWDGEDIVGLKLIDFGSAFMFGTTERITATTPEYLAPEVLQFLENKLPCLQQTDWSYDMWSLGAILLEIITGFPIWMSLKCKTTTKNNKSCVSTGIFGVKGREHFKIL